MSGAIAIDGNIYEQARTRIAAALSVLMSRKNVPSSEVCRQGIATLLADHMSMDQLTGIAQGSPDAETIRQISDVAENELDWNRAIEAIRIFARAADIDAITDLELTEMAGRMIDRLRGGAANDAATLCWPSLQAIEQIAAKRFLDPGPYDLAALEAALSAERAMLEALVTASWGHA